MYKPDKETLLKFRKTVGHGYAPAIREILSSEHGYVVKNDREIYDVAHGRSENDVIMQAFLKLVIRKGKAAAPVKSLLDEAMKVLTPNAA